jgi:A/G-specific adenine glycosylase
MTKKEHQFVETVWKYYTEQGRHELPWRHTRDPYSVLVSEMMLQQTQVDRVIPKYEAFLKKYPTTEKLAKASLGDVLKLWQGLGYNRRAKMLLSCAQTIVREHKGAFPRTESDLLKLPGVGPYTARAILAFAYNTPTSLIETNVRNVYLHHFFKKESEIPDVQLMPIITRTRDEKKSREWYYALMDYGSFLKKTQGNTNTKSAHYTKQSIFKGSDRQIRGAIIRLLTTKSYSRLQLHSALASFEDMRIDAQIENLVKEGLIQKTATKYNLPK